MIPKTICGNCRHQIPDHAFDCPMIRMFVKNVKVNPNLKEGRAMAITRSGSEGVTVRDTEVSRCLSMVRNLAGRIKDTASLVSERFSPVMKQEPVRKDREIAEMTNVSTPLAIELQDIAKILDETEEILADASSRCEL